MDLFGILMLHMKQFQRTCLWTISDDSTYPRFLCSGSVLLHFDIQTEPAVARAVVCNTHNYIHGRGQCSLKVSSYFFTVM